LLTNNQIDEIVELCEQLPEVCLLAALPTLAGMNHPQVISFLEKTIAKSTAFANRFFMITNQRPAFQHLHHLTAQIQTPSFIHLCATSGKYFEKGQVIAIEGGVHPFTNEPISQFKVDHVFSSLARPMILSFPDSTTTEESNNCRVLMKQNEDIYHEAAIQTLFKALNEFWVDYLPAALRPFVCSFREIPASPRLGFLQIVEGCKDLEEIERSHFQDITPDKVENFIVTTCGWALAAYLLGLSDRHRENTLVRTSDGSAIPIDFGFMLGNTAPSVNTYMITLSAQMYRFLKEHRAWTSFSIMFLAGFLTIRQHAEPFLRLAEHLFTGHRDPAFVRKFISYRLLLHEKDDIKVLHRMTRRLRHAPVCSDTRQKIDNHRKNKQFLAKHGRNFLVRLVINRAVEAKPEIHSEGLFHCIHKSRVKLTFPEGESLPTGTPETLRYFVNVYRSRSSGKQRSPRGSASLLFNENENSPIPVDPEMAPHFFQEEIREDSRNSQKSDSDKEECQFKVLVRSVKSLRNLVVTRGRSGSQTTTAE
jgi:hypothetical protein